MVTPEWSDVVFLVVSGIFFSSAIFLALTMFRLMWCEGRRYFGSARRKNVAHRYKTDKNLCNTNWAMLTSLSSTLMFVGYGTYFMYEYLTYHNGKDKNDYQSLTGHIPFIPNVMAVTFRSIAILLVLSHSLWKLDQKYTENDESPVEYCTILCLRFLICLSSIFTFIGIFIDHFHNHDRTYWYYYTNIAGYSVAAFVIFWIGKLFYQRLKECDLEAITDEEISQISQSETRSLESLPIPVISQSGENKIDHLSKQVLLSWIQSIFVIICCIIQASIYVYYYCKRHNNHYNNYFTLPIQCITLCSTIILINWCIWLSLEFTHEWYKYFCCCHSYVRDSIRKEVKMGRKGMTPGINNNTGMNPSINQATMTNIGYDYSGARLQDEPINKADLKINAAYRDRKKQAYKSIGSAPANQGDFNNNMNINAIMDIGSSMSGSGVSINNFSTIS